MRPILSVALFIVAASSHLVRPVFNAQRLGRAEQQPRVAVNLSEREQLPKAEKRGGSVMTNITLIPPEKLDEAANILREARKVNDQTSEYRDLLSPLIAAISNVTKCYQNYKMSTDVAIDVCHDEYAKLVQKHSRIQSVASRPGFPAELLFSEKLPHVTNDRESQQGDATKRFQKTLEHLHKAQDEARKFEPIVEKMYLYRDLLERLYDATLKAEQCYKGFLNKVGKDGVESLDTVSGDLSPCELEAAIVDSRQREVEKHRDTLRTPGGKAFESLELANLPKLDKETASLKKYQASTAETRKDGSEQVRQLNATIFKEVHLAVNGSVSEAVRDLQNYVVLSEGKAGKSAAFAVEAAKKRATEFLKQLSTISDEQYDEIVNQAVSAVSDDK